MSLHRSLKIDITAKKRTVRKKRERIQSQLLRLLQQGGLSEAEAIQQLQVFNLPKEKVFRLKVKKIKKEEKTTNDEIQNKSNI